MSLESNSKAPAYKRRRKRTFLMTPIAVALSTLLIFIFFVSLGSRKSKSLPLGSTAEIKRINTGQPTLYTYSIMAEYPHDPTAFTQGLEYDERCDGGGPCKQVFWESTGLKGRSTVREVDLKTGKVLRSKDLPKSDFGEGITKLGNKLYQVTWLSGKGWIYSVDNFNSAKEIKTPLADGWGITNNGTHLIVGDSSHILYFLDPQTLQVVYELPITDDGQPVKWLNELEWVDGLIYANIYQTECIAQIDPVTGGVVGWMVMEGLRQHMLETMQQKQNEAPDVLNGIAWDSRHARLFLTGKLWPKVYQIEARPMYLDSKATDVAGVTEQIREMCIVDENASLG